MCGMGVEGVPAKDVAWTWKLGTGQNGFWAGRVEGGLFVKLRGEGPQWEDPMYSSDYGTIPFIPNSWGGANATPATTQTATGANVSVAADAVTLVAYSGPRSLSGKPTPFRFDLAATPSKPLNLTAHFEQRYLQVGYGTHYISPQEAAASNVSVITLHQGIPGVINGTMAQGCEPPQIHTLDGEPIHQLALCAYPHVCSRWSRSSQGSPVLGSSL